MKWAFDDILGVFFLKIVKFNKCVGLRVKNCLFDITFKILKVKFKLFCTKYFNIV